MTNQTAVKIGIVVAAVGVVSAIAGIGAFLFEKWQTPTVANSQLNGDAQKKAALDAALQAGIVTQDEYNAKLRTLSSTLTPAKPAGSAPAAAAAKNSWKVWYPVMGMPAYRVTVPADWTFVGAVIRSPCEGARLVYRTESPDGLTGVQPMPNVKWIYSKNDQVLHVFRDPTCGLHPPVSALEQAPVIAHAARPNSTLGTAEPWTVPGAAEAYAKFNAMAQSQAGAMGNAAVFQGHADEELPTVSTTITDQPVSVAGTGANGIQPGWARQIEEVTYANGFRAPEGRLNAVRQR